MATERTFSIIKPDATGRNITGAINALIEKAGLRIVAQKRIRMTREQAETFYAVHKARPARVIIAPVGRACQTAVLTSHEPDQSATYRATG